MFLRTAPLVLAFALILASAFLFILFHRLRTARQSLRNSQVRLSAALRESEASRSLLAAVFAAQTDPILVFGADGKVVRTNPAAHRSWGFDPTGWHHSEVLAKLDIRPEWGVGFIERALAGEATLNLEVKAGTRMLEASSAPMRDFEGCIIGAVVVQRDATSRHRMRSALEMTIRDLEVALQEKTILLKEVHHRVKNNLAVISSVLAMKVDAAHSAETRQALEDSRQRVRSMALIHEQLYGQENLHKFRRVYGGTAARADGGSGKRPLAHRRRNCPRTNRTSGEPRGPLRSDPARVGDECLQACLPWRPPGPGAGGLPRMGTGRCGIVRSG